VEKMIPRLFGNTTLNTRADLVEMTRRFMLRMSPKGISLLQRGMAERPDSMETLKTINVQTLIMAGDEDVLTPVSEAELMRQNIPGAQLRVIQRGGHFTPFEQAEPVGLLLRQFCDQSMGV
jgi:pimeloyl-ACP methyl ester carboxylesterase